MKRIVYLIATVVALLFATMPIVAKEQFPLPEQDGVLKETPNAAHLYLYEKDADWIPVVDGAWGKLTYDPIGTEFNYVFNGHGLQPEIDYTLIYYPDPWPGTGLQCLGTELSNHGGNVHIMGSLETGSLPSQNDANFKWNLVGVDWKWSVLGTYLHDVVIETQNDDGTFTGFGGYPAGAEVYTYKEAISGKVEGNQITLTTIYEPGGYTATAIGNIDAEGRITGSNPWAWEMIEGLALPSGGAKIWLVTNNDVNCETHAMSAWNPDEYLFEENLITFTQITQ